MANMGIEFGNRMNMGGTGIDSARLRETHERLIGGGVAGGSETAGAGSSFGDYLARLANDANQAQLVADKRTEEVAVGKTKDLHGALLAVEKADVQFRLLTQVRNKVIEAYREIMRMQV